MRGATGSEFDEADLRQVGSDRIWIEPKFACPTQIHLAQGGIHLDPIREKLLEISEAGSRSAPSESEAVATTVNRERRGEGTEKE
ncbi:hypothetical protein FCM35_KLT06903 [Carex littledalei]|uniref:Uncharacterized protein n=1 Tax=Carex littledalei TaxID=544730 RepID=A0A833QWH4_9POAL|nr:hypothetical protein FCM35_KLT06903 [Carex littledalei]